MKVLNTAKAAALLTTKKAKATAAWAATAKADLTQKWDATTQPWFARWYKEKNAAYGSLTAFKSGNAADTKTALAAAKKLESENKALVASTDKTMVAADAKLKKTEATLVTTGKALTKAEAALKALELADKSKV